VLMPGSSKVPEDSNNGPVLGKAAEDAAVPEESHETANLCDLDAFAADGIQETDERVEVRVAVVGNVDSGKSTVTACLARGGLDVDLRDHMCFVTATSRRMDERAPLAWK